MSNLIYSPIFLSSFLYFFLFLHIFFISITIGVSCLSIYFQLQNLKSRKLKKTIYLLAKTIKISLINAITIAFPLIIILNYLYNINHHYPDIYYSVFLVRKYCLLIFLLIITSLLLLNAHHLTWRNFNQKIFHLIITIIATIMLLGVYIYGIIITNISLLSNHTALSYNLLQSMQNPYIWIELLYFLLNMLMFTAIYLIGFVINKKPSVLRKSAELSRFHILRIGYKLAFVSIMLKFLLGFIILFSFKQWITDRVFIIIIFNIIIMFFSLILILLELQSNVKIIGIRFYKIFIMIIITILFLEVTKYFYIIDSVESLTKL